MDVLISGASMAGLSAAHWFVRTGHDVTVVERADGLRRGGAPIDVRGEALCVAARMGILGEIRDRKVPSSGPGPVYDGSGEQVAVLDLSWFANEWDDDVEISRDRLNDVLLASVDDSVRFRFHTSIDTLDDGVERADVTLSDGSSSSYDLVVGADGLHSNVRRLAFGPEVGYVRHIGAYVALVDLPADETWDLGMLNVPGLMIAVRDIGDGPFAMLITRCDELDFDHRDFGAQRSIVVDALDALDAWQVPRIRESFGDPSSAGFYFDSVAQIQMPGWTTGHVALIGDAAHCPALLSGMGTSLAMIAAEQLASHWTATGGDLERASGAYHDRLRPFVARAQASVGDGGGVVVPATQDGLDQRNEMFREVARQRGAI